jgi:hypothetical protein
MKCKTCTPARRLLAAEDSVIRFALKGDLAAVKAVWHQAISDSSIISNSIGTSTSNSSIIAVVIHTSDAVAEMQRIQTHLLQMTSVEVVTQPYVVIPVAMPPPPNNADSGASNTGVIVAAVLIPCVFLVVGILAYGDHAGWYKPNPQLGAYMPVRQTVIHLR